LQSATSAADGAVMKSSSALDALEAVGQVMSHSACPRRHRAEIHLGADREARHVERAERDLPPGALSRAGWPSLLLVEVAMGRDEGLLLGSDANDMPSTK
jgi:hypothetical protein